MVSSLSYWSESTFAHMRLRHGGEEEEVVKKHLKTRHGQSSPEKQTSSRQIRVSTYRSKETYHQEWAPVILEAERCWSGQSWWWKCQ